MLVGKLFEFSVGLIFVGLVKNKVLKEVEIILREALIGEVGVLSQDVSSQVIMLVLAVKQDKVREGLRWEGRVVKQEV
jgi:hypothetical protein